MERVAQLLAKGMQPWQIIEVIGREFGIVGRTVETYIRRVKDLWSKEGAKYRAQARDTMRAMLFDSYYAARTQGDLKAAAVFLDRLCKLDGLYMPEADTGAGVSGEIKPDAIRDRMKLLAERSPAIRLMLLRGGKSDPVPQPAEGGPEISDPVPQPDDYADPGENKGGGYV